MLMAAYKKHWIGGSIASSSFFFFFNFLFDNDTAHSNDTSVAWVTVVSVSPLNCGS